MRYSELNEFKSNSGLYVGVNFSEDTIDNIVAYQQQHDIPNPTPATKLHTTILYSRKSVPWSCRDDEYEVSPEGSEITVFGSRDGNRCLVWKYQSEELAKRFEHGMDLGATFDYGTYKPHITLSYDIGDFDETKLPVPEFVIAIIGEYSEPIKEKWADTDAA